MDNNKCASSGACAPKCCVVRDFIVPVVAVFATLFIFNWVFHGVIMMPSYKATASVWRPQADMEHLCYINLIKDGLLALVITCFYCCIRKSSTCTGCPVKGAAKFGFKVGAIIGLTSFGSYFYLPIPLEMALSWLAGNIVMGVLAGIVLGLVSRKKDVTTA